MVLFCFPAFFSLLWLTDVSAGHSVCMLDAMRHAVQASNTLYITKGDKEYQFLSHNEAFYMATMGGARGVVGGRG